MVAHYLTQFSVFIIYDLFCLLHGQVLEVASGLGVHVELFAAQLPQLRWQPSEYSDDAVLTLRDRLGAAPNIAAPVQLDCSSGDWGPAERRASLAAVVAINLTHISPMGATRGLAAGAGRCLRPGGRLFIYGPFLVDGQPTTPSNAEFDASLRGRNPEWGYRDVEEVTRIAAACGLQREEVEEMPANNLLLVFCKPAAAA